MDQLHVVVELGIVILCCPCKSQMWKFPRLVLIRLLIFFRSFVSIFCTSTLQYTYAAAYIAFNAAELY